MDNFNLHQNQARFVWQSIDAICEGFKTALIWQDGELDEFNCKAVSYAAQEKTQQTVLIFLSLVCTSESAATQLLEHGLGKTGHDLALQMVGHGVGFWEQKVTNELDIILSFLLDMKAIKPFHFYYDSDNDFLDWESC